MPHPGHRLDLVLVFDDAEDVARGWRLLVDECVIDADGAASRHAVALIRGGFVRALSLERESGVWGNQAGGFRALCPVTGAIVTAAATRAFTLRVREIGCPSCGECHLVRALTYRPPVGFGPAALVLCDVADGSLTEQGTVWMKRIGRYQTVYRRP